MATIQTRHITHGAADNPAEGAGSVTDLAAHQRTFDGFVSMLKWHVIAIIAILIFLALANA